jgi:hypothetical protein
VRVRRALERLYERVPAARPAMVAVNDALKRPSFTGWGMRNQHAVPWDDEHDWAHFREATAHVRTGFEHGLADDTAVTPATVDGLRWRHWIVAFSVRYACGFADGPVTLVECGVGDGLTAYFACLEAEHLQQSYEMHCYDVWAEVTTDAHAAGYAGSALARTKRNLSRFRVDYHPGLIPGSLDQGAPRSVHYLSVDLNAAAPTIAALEFFVSRLAPRAVILFDDYGHGAFTDTRRAVDAFFAGRRGALMKLPTGQAIWFS